MFYPQFKIDSKIQNAAAEVMKKITPRLQEIDEITEYNQQKMMAAFHEAGVSESHFVSSTGYGYGDRGRDALDMVYAKALGAEDALVRHNFVSGTHALTVALFGVLRPGDTMLSVTGIPYDTLRGVIGMTGDANGSLKEFGIHYKEVQLKADGTPDYQAIEQAIEPNQKMVYIQRSRGYSLRPSLLIEDIEKIAAIAKKKAPNCIVMVDNCYGEFTELSEPTDVGVDMMAGSLIKNPGGGLAPVGGYIVGKKECVENAACRLTSPGLAKEVGASLGILNSFYQGFFLAPTVTAGALKGAIFAANIYEACGFPVVPNGSESRHDIIQAVELGTAEGVIAFCRGIQAAAPVDSYVTPEPWAMPGYDSDVIMAAGAFVQGSSIELSADGPIKPPYAVYFQGGLTWQHAKLGILMSLQKLYDADLVRLPL